MNRSIALSGLLMAALTLAACESGERQPTEKVEDVMQQTALEHAVKHTDPKYVCPMHPQIIRDEPGNCPLCGMDLVAVEQDDAGAETERKLLYYRHPHNPTVTSDKPMKDEMGMDFVPVYEESGVGVKISPTVVHNMGVRTARVERDRLWRRIDTVGYVDFDENMLSHIHLRTDGWIERLVVKSEGEEVKRGDVLFELYSPTLVNAQEEYLQAVASRSKPLISASKGRLASLGLTQHQIRQLAEAGKAQQKLKIYAPQDGIVASLKVREGMYVKPATEVMTLADLSSVWLLAEVFESQADWVRVGAPAEVKLSYLPGKLWEGEVEYIYPSLDPKTRTLKARLRFDNPDLTLKPNMFADITIYGGAKRDILVVPREALIRTGRQERLILDRGEGRFTPRLVKSGIEVGDWVEIIEGVREGDTVVTSGQFLIDSEASLKASILRLSDAASSLTMDEESKPVMGTGRVKGLMPGEQKINLQHEPIPAIGWPSMTMDFDLDAGVNTEGLQMDDPVMFELKQTDKGYVISNIHKQAQGNRGQGAMQ